MNPSNMAASSLIVVCSARWIQTTDQWIMSPISYHCSIALDCSSFRAVDIVRASVYFLDAISSPVLPRVYLITSAIPDTRGICGANGARSHNLILAKDALYQLSYCPVLPPHPPGISE